MILFVSVILRAKFPDHGYTAIVLSNYDPPDDKKIADKICDTILDSISQNKM
jgi:hypothetical protein